MADNAPYIDPGLIKLDRATNVYGFPDGSSSRLRLARRAGEQYGQKREVYEVAGYPSEEELDATDGAVEYFRSMYERTSIAGRIIDLPAKVCWGTAPQILGEDGEEIPFTRTFDQFADRLNLFGTFLRADRLTGIGYFSVVLIGTRTATDQDLLDPLQVRSLDDVVLLEPYAQEWVELSNFGGDPNDPRLNKPTEYMVDLSGGLTGKREGGAQPNLRLHWSRVLHLTEDALDSEVYGRPRLKRVFNRLKDLEKVMAATGEAYWQEAVRWLLIKIDSEADISGDDLNTLMDQVNSLTHDLRRHIAGKNMEINVVGGATPDPSGALDALIQLVAADSDIPTRILVGSQSGERASTEDRKAFLGQMADRQRNHCEPMFIRHLLNRLRDAGVSEIPDDYMVQWPPLHTESRQEIEEGNLSVARAAQALTPVGGDPTRMITVDEDGLIKLLPLDESEAMDDIIEPEDILPQENTDDLPEADEE